MKQLSTDRCSLALPGQLHSLISGNLFPKYFVSVLVLALMFGITSCQKENLQDVSQGPNAIGASMNKSIHDAIPFKASYTTTSPMLNLINGTGVGSIVGKSTFTLHEDESNFPLLAGTATITAANGDQIFSTHTGSVVGPDDSGVLLITNYNIVTGGTGRFAGATGNFVAHAIASIYVTTGTVTFDGTISLR